MEEIRNITYGLWGHELSHVQTIQRIIVAGFPIWKNDPKPHSPALTMFAICEGESGEYQRAWHANVARWPENAEDTTAPFAGKIKRHRQMPDLSFQVIPEDDADEDLMFMRVNSIDLGFLQRNRHQPDNTYIEMSLGAVEDYVNGLFETYPELAVPWSASADAFSLWKTRGFQPWYAYKPGTEGFKSKMSYGALAFGNWLVHSFVDPNKDMVYKQ